MRALRWTFPVVLVTSSALAQNPNDVSFALASKGNQTKFRMGEEVSVELRFQSSVPGRYQIWTTSGTRHVRIPRFDRFTVEPSRNVADPLWDIPAQVESGGIGGVAPRPVPLGGNAVVLKLDVNEWVSFRRPGRYRITAQTTRVETADQSSTPVLLRSNPLEIEVVRPEPGWAAAQLEQAIATLEPGDPPNPAIGQHVDMRAEELRAEQARAGRVLRFLETRDAVRALVRFFENGPRAAQQDVHAGLFGSPYRSEVIAAMEQAVAAPDVPITYYYLATLMELVSASRMGPSPLYPFQDPEAHKAQAQEHSRYLERMKPIEAEYFAKLAQATGRKRGQALAVSLATLVTRGPQPPAPSVASALTENFQSLPPASQHSMLTIEWPRFASPRLEPLLRSLAESSAPMRDEALLRLYEFNPDAARKIAISRIRKGDVTREMYSNSRALLLLPDKTLPELDDALLNALERGKPVEFLVARYASEAVLEGVRAFSGSRQGLVCGPLLAYFFRVDPAFAAERLAFARKSRLVGCVLTVSSTEGLLMSPELEKAAIEDLAIPDVMFQRNAQTLLRDWGSAAAEQPLWEGLARLRERTGNPTDQRGLEYGFVDALLKASSWILNSEKIDRLMAACITDSCRASVASERRTLQAPVRISLMFGSDMTSVGPFLLRNPRQLAAKIAQFPKGTQFFFGPDYEGTWLREQRMREIHGILDAAGMEVVEPPAQPKGGHVMWRAPSEP